MGILWLLFAMVKMAVLVWRVILGDGERKCRVE
jgi:hypothetical protein